MKWDEKQGKEWDKEMKMGPWDLCWFKVGHQQITLNSTRDKFGRDIFCCDQPL